MYRQTEDGTKQLHKAFSTMLECLKNISLSKKISLSKNLYFFKNIKSEYLILHNNKSLQRILEKTNKLFLEIIKKNMTS